MRSDPPSSTMAQPQDSRLDLFESQRENVQRQIAEVSHRCDVPPWRILVLVLDLRSEFGRDIALRLFDRVDIDRTIRTAEVRGEPPGLTVALPDIAGLAIISLFTPQLESQVLQRPALTATLLIVDEWDHAIIGIGRFHEARFAVS